jgi:hypothetical protein
VNQTVHHFPLLPYPDTTKEGREEGRGRQAGVERKRIKKESEHLYFTPDREERFF